MKVQPKKLLQCNFKKFTSLKYNPKSAAKTVINSNEGVEEQLRKLENN